MSWLLRSWEHRDTAVLSLDILPELSHGAKRVSQLMYGLISCPLSICWREFDEVRTLLMELSQVTLKGTESRTPPAGGCGPGKPVMKLEEGLAGEPVGKQGARRAGDSAAGAGLQSESTRPRGA